MTTLVLMRPGCENGRRWRSHRNVEFGVQCQICLHGHPSQSGPCTSPQRQRFTGRRGRGNGFRVANVRDSFVVIPPSGQVVAATSRQLPSSHAWSITTSSPSAVTDRRTYSWLHVVQPVCPGYSYHCYTFRQ